MTTVVRLRGEELRDDLNIHAECGWEYTEPMPSGEWAGTKTDLGLVLLPFSSADPAPALSYVCLATKGKKWTTRFARAKFSRLVAVQPPLHVNEWLNAVPERFRSHLSYAIEITGRPIPPGTWAHSRAALVELRPEIVDHLAELELILDSRVDFTEHEQEILLQQKDAVGVALSVAGIKRAPLAAWQPTARHAPWLTGIEPGQVREDVMVVHDAARAPGWAAVDEPYVGVTEFSDRAKNRLTVMNVNRHKIEEITGVDLLYYRHEPESFALVQYKRMTRRKSFNESEKGRGGLEFRPSSDRGFEDELERMRAVEAHVGETGGDHAADGRVDPLPFDPVLHYRLHPHACWIKLCHPEAFRPVESDLVNGMYLPLDYYEELAKHVSTIGPKGGRVIAYYRVPRWINNTLFIELMSGGWIGSRTFQTAWLSETVQAALSARRSVVIAEEKRSRPKRQR